MTKLKIMIKVKPRIKHSSELLGGEGNTFCATVPTASTSS